MIMGRPATARPAGEHHAIVARMLRQVAADRKMKPRRRSAISRHLEGALRELEKEMR